MEILNYNDFEIKKCNNCETTLCVGKNDYKIGEHGFLYYQCPVCSKNNYTKEHIQLDETNIQYPDNFEAFECNEFVIYNKYSEIQNKCRELIKKIKQSGSQYMIDNIGELLVIVTRVEKENYSIIVTPSYDECFVYSK
jgi:hypothetical protein